MPIIEIGKKYFKSDELKEGTVLKIVGIAEVVTTKFPYSAEQIKKNPALEGKFKEQIEVEVSMGTEIKTLAINGMSYDNIKLKWGKNSDDWKGKSLICKKHKHPAGGFMTELQPVEFED